VAEYFDIDVTLVRLVCLLTAILTGIGLIAYVVGWIVMPNEPELLPAAPANAEQVHNH
jgi:phage shock protein C